MRPWLVSESNSSCTAMAEQEQVKLLGSWSSPFVRRVEWALKLKGVPYDYIEEDLRNKSPLLLKYNPIYKKVPVLVHGGNPLSESLVIVEYIDETWKHNPLLPEDPHARALARFWAKFIDDKLLEHVRNVVFTEGEQQEKEVKQAVEALENIEGELKGKKFLGGGSFGFVDIVLAWLPTSLEAAEEVSGVRVFDSGNFPLIREWMKRIKELPIIKDNSPPKDKLAVSFQKLRQIKLAAYASTK